MRPHPASLRRRAVLMSLLLAAVLIGIPATALAYHCPEPARRSDVGPPAGPRLNLVELRLLLRLLDDLVHAAHVFQPARERAHATIGLEPRPRRMPPMTDTSLIVRRLAFVRELDKLKHVLRQTSLIDGSRRENSAEHSWHIATMAIILADHAAMPFDLGHALKLLLLHDVVEIDAGDTFCYDADGNLDKEQREHLAAERLFGLLPPPQDAELRALWEEFEAADTPEARFAHAMDRLEPLLQNHANGGGTWRLHGITRAQVLARMAPIATAVPGLWPTVMTLIDEACAAGDIAPDPRSMAG